MLMAPMSGSAADFCINEIQANTAGTDWKFIEIQGEPGSDLGSLTLLAVESDQGEYAGTLDTVINLTGLFSHTLQTALHAFYIIVPPVCYSNESTSRATCTFCSGSPGDRTSTHAGPLRTSNRLALSP